MDDIRTLGAGKYLHLVANGQWEWAQRPAQHDAVCIIAATEDQELLLVEQFRYPLNGNTIELPAGLVGDEIEAEGEATLDAAKRELQEETGFVSEHWRSLGRFASSAGMTSEAPHIVIADKCRQVGPGGGVDGEDITVHRLALNGAEDWIKAQQARGLMIDARVMFGIAVARGAVTI